MSDFFAQTEVSARYAKAAFDLATEQNCLDAVMQDLKAFKTMIADSADLRRLLSDVRYDSATQSAGVTAVLEAARFDDLTKKAIGLVVKNGRARHIGGVITGFAKLYDDKMGIVAAEVTSAVAMTEAQTESLKAALKAAIGRDAVVNTSVDPSLLGGLKVKLGSRLFDASLKTKLDSLKFALRRA